VAIACQRQPHTLAGWWLTVDDSAQAVTGDQTCTTAVVPVTARIGLTNPHHYLVATVVVADALCGNDIAWCQPVPSVPPPATPQLVRHQATRATASQMSHAEAGETLEAVTVVAPTTPTAVPVSRWPLLQVGALCVLAGILGLRVLASAPNDVLYSDTDADATSSAESIAQRVEDGASSTNDPRERHR